MFRSPFRASSYQTTAFRKPGSWACGYHTGVDRVCSMDPTLVSIGSGFVESVNACGASYGNHIVLRLGGKYSVLYAHLAAAPALKAGAKVAAGTQLGRMGNTGNSSGEHLHIEIQSGARWAYAANLIDPNSMIDWNDFGKEKDDYIMKTWKNGSTMEPVYQTTADCKARKNPIGYLSAGETATCRAVTSGCYLIEYLAGGAYKAGYVAYAGGVR